MMQITLNTHSPRSNDYTREVARALAECVRVLNHHTASAAAMPYPSTVYEVLGNLHATLSGLPQLLRQLGDRLTDLEATGRVCDGRDRDDAALAARTLDAVRAHLRARQIAEAHREAGHLALRDEPTEAGEA